MIVSMKRLTLVAHKTDESAILRVLQPLEAVEVLPCDACANDSERLRSAESHVQALSDALSLLKPYAKKPGLLTPKPEATLSEISDALPAALQHSEEVEAFQRELSRIRSETEKNAVLIQTLQPWADLPSRMDACRGSSYISYFTGLLDVSEIEHLSACEHEIEYQVFGGSETAPAAVLLACTPSDAKDVSRYLKMLDWTECVLPNLSRTPQEEINRLQEQNAVLQQEQDMLVRQLMQKSEIIAAIEGAYDAAVIERDRYSAMAAMRETATTFELEAWAPEDRLEQIESAVRSVTDAYCLFARDPQEGETPPVVVRNNSFVEPFEQVTNLYSPPSPFEIDATPYMTPFYVFLFGMMLSDTGYGILLALGCWIFNRLTKPSGMVGGIVKVLFWGGLSTVVWGFLIGSFFGLDFDVLFGTTDVFPLLMDPMEQPIPMLIFCFGFGIIHIICGMILKIRLCLSAGDWQTAVFDNLSWILVIVGVIVYICSSVVSVFPPFVGVIGLIVVIVGALMLLLFKGREKKNFFTRTISGLGELYQVTSYLSDILSYARLFALGIATGVIASVFNQLCSMLMSGANPIIRVLGFLISIVLLVFLHLFNLAINTLGTFVHCARLQYVEFYGKFYEGGGKLFRPFRYSTKHVRLNQDH